MADRDIPNRAKLQSTFIPKKAGNLVLSAVMMLLSSATTLPFLVSRSFRLGTLTLKPAFFANFMPWSKYSDFRPCRSAATASISGPSVVVNFSGSFSMMSWRKVGSDLYML